MRNLILTGGVRHDFTTNTEILIRLLAQVGIDSEFTSDIDAGISCLQTESFDLVTVMALRWQMLGNPKYAAQRAEYGYSMSAQNRTVLEQFVQRGGGLFGLHTACLCFDDWPQWSDLLGGAWVWGESSHPPRGRVQAAPTEQGHILTDGLPAFELTDEVYSDLILASDTVPLLTARAGEGAAQPVLWARNVGNGRVVFDALGHDGESLQHPLHSRLVQRCALWAGGLADDRISRI